MTPSEFYSHQFYSWEYRGRGWHLASSPIQLEPPFMPFFRHGYAEKQIDDAKRHTVVSKLIENLKGKKEVIIEDDVLDYDQLEIFLYPDKVNLKALQVKFPKQRRIAPDKMKAFILMLSHNEKITSFEIIGNSKEIIIQFVCDIEYSDTVEIYLKAYFPECSVINSDLYLKEILGDNRPTTIVDFGLRNEFVRPLRSTDNFLIDPLLDIWGILEYLSASEYAGIQVLFQPTANPWSESIVRSVTIEDGTSFFEDAPEAPELAHEKIQKPLYAVTIRAYAQADFQELSNRILEKLGLSLMNASRGPYNELVPLLDENYDFQTRIDDLFARRSHRMGMLLNLDELVSLLHFPSESIISPKFNNVTRKTNEPPSITKNKEFTLGENYHNGVSSDLTFGIEDRLKHTHIIGATGTGKSTLIANLILQDIEKRIGVILFDPHGDLVDDIISHIPEERLKDVVLIDPSDSEYPIGLNVLQANSEIEKEVLSSDLVASFRRYSTSWGDQMNAIFGNAVLAMLEAGKSGTLHDLRRFLLEKEFRSNLLKKIEDPSIIYYWQNEFPLIKTNSISPILTRLDTFLRPKNIRNMIAQGEGLNFESLLNENKIVLLKLSQGLIGKENSFILGSLMLSGIHQAILRRQKQDYRNPAFLYLDEFQNFITPSIQEMLNGIRKYNVGLILSHQDLQQLHKEGGELLNSVLGNIYTRVVFRIGGPDAKQLQYSFANFDLIDLQSLGVGEAIMRIEQPRYDCSLNTLPLYKSSLEETKRKIDTVLANTRKKYATPKGEVEERLFASLKLNLHLDNNVQEILKEKVVSTRGIETPFTPLREKKVVKEPAVTQPTEDINTHRYLQQLVKKMAEARGYTAVIEMQLPDGSGNVDVLIAKEGQNMAIEICNTTNSDWEVHNISKCLNANYDMVVSLSGDQKQLDKIRKKCSTDIVDFENKSVKFFTPDAFFSYLDDSIKPDILSEKSVMKGYRINVSYESASKEEMSRKRMSIAKVVLNSLNKFKPK